MVHYYTGRRFYACDTAADLDLRPFKASRNGILLLDQGKGSVYLYTSSLWVGVYQIGTHQESSTVFISYQEHRHEHVPSPLL